MQYVLVWTSLLPTARVLVSCSYLFSLVHLQVVMIETVDKEESTRYSIPISTSIRFSPLYDPNDNMDEARRGFVFETVGEMMSRKTLPKVHMKVQWGHILPQL